MSDFVLCMPLLYNSEPQGLPQSTTKWQGSCWALIFCLFTAACGPSHLRKTWMKYLNEIPDGSPRLFNNGPASCAVIYLNTHAARAGWDALRPSLHASFAFRHLWCKIASSISSSPVFSSPIYWAEHAWSSEFYVKILTATLPQNM